MARNKKNDAKGQNDAKERRNGVKENEYSDRMQRLLENRCGNYVKACVYLRVFTGAALHACICIHIRISRYDAKFQMLLLYAA